MLPGARRQGKKLPQQPWRALPTQTNLVPAWELLQNPPSPTLGFEETETL